MYTIYSKMRLLYYICFNRIVHFQLIYILVSEMYKFLLKINKIFEFDIDWSVQQEENLLSFAFCITAIVNKPIHKNLIVNHR